MSIFVDKDAKFIIGNHVHIGPNTAIDCHSSITIGDDTMVAWNCTIMNRDGHSIVDLSTKEVLNPIKDVSIGNHCWICQNSILLKGTKIPDNSVVVAGSIMTKKMIDSNCIYANNRKIKENVDIEF